MPNGGKGKYETVSRTKKGSGGLDGALHLTPNTSRILGTGDHGVTPINNNSTRGIYGKLKAISMQELEYSIS